MSLESNNLSSVFRKVSVIKTAVSIIIISLIVTAFTGIAVAQTVEDSASVYKFIEAVSTHI